MYNNKITLVTEVVENSTKFLAISKISGVHYESSMGVVIDANGSQRDYSLEVVIPRSFICSEYYARPKEYKAFTIERKLDHFTLDSGQLIILGVVDIPYRSMDEIMSNMDNVYKIVSVTEYYSSLPHFEVYCK